MLSAVVLLLANTDADYRREVARDTWRCIASLEETSTGLPYDNSDRAAETSVSNIGFYLVSVLCAREWGFIDKKEESQRLDRTLTSLERLPTWFGFNQSWNNVKSLQPGQGDRWVSVLDSGNLCAALVTVAEARPEFCLRATKLFERHDWKSFWRGNFLVGGYDVGNKAFNEKWRLDALATDATFAQLFSVGTGTAPKDFAQTLRRDQVRFAGQSVMWPAQEGGGLFMQAMPRLFLGLNGSDLSESTKRYILAQAAHAKELNAPAWGWSACDDPAGGYLGWAHLKDSVITPHASGLAMRVNPRAATENLRALERLGARSPRNGFYDAYDWKTGKASSKFLVLDQSMMLIGLTTTLPDDPVYVWFTRAKVVQSAGRW